MIKWSALLLCLIVSSSASAQFTYSFNQGIPVIDNGEVLELAWAGGINSAQYNTMHLNDDEVEDLVVFDRVANRVLTFLAVDRAYRYAPTYETYFPKGLKNWMLLRDYDCDGRKDIFSSDPRGIVVYKNITEPGGILSWRIFNFREGQNLKHLLTQGFNSAINLQVKGQDLPAIDDVDNDGDLDILAYRFTGESTIEFHRNMSMELDGSCDSLQFVRVTQTWGEFEECECGSFAFNGQACPPEAGGRQQHESSKSLLTLDTNGDQVKDVLMSEQECSELFLVTNSGTQQMALMSSATPFPPNAPVFLPVYPAAFNEDVDFDGVKDLLVSPNLPANFANAINFESSGYFYKNKGTNQLPSFELVSRNFLQNEMIEVGENAVPAFYDIDADGDLDMVVGAYLQFENIGLGSSLVLYRNIGTVSEPAFEKENEDYLSLSLINAINIKPTFEDVNGDGRVDLVFSATEVSTGHTHIFYVMNKADKGYEPQFDKRLLFSLGTVFPNYDNFKLFDLDTDGLLDLFIGRNNGRLEYHRNVGSKTSPSFQLVDESFYGRELNVIQRSPAATFDDFNADGLIDMVVGDASGTLSMYSDIRNSLDNPETAITQLLGTESGNNVEVHLGHSIVPVSVNLFNQDRPLLIVGTGSGGLHVLAHDEAVDFTLPGEDRLALFPNPVVKSEPLKVVSSRPMTLSIASVNGKIIYEGITLGAGKITNLGIDDLSEGLYLMIGKHAEGTEVKRFLVVD